MGKMLYGSPPAVFEIDDHRLAHIELVALAKLRRNESFAMSVSGEGTARTSFWMNTASVVVFEFENGEQQISRELLDEYMDAANTAGGLRLAATTDEA